MTYELSPGSQTKLHVEFSRYILPKPINCVALLWDDMYSNNVEVVIIENTHGPVLNF